MPEKKIKVLALCDSPTAPTGFGQVAKNVLNGLARTGKYQIDVIGINYYGNYYDREKFPYAIYPANPGGVGEIYGRDTLIRAISGDESKNGLQAPWDIIWTLEDPFVIEGLGFNLPFGEQLVVSSQIWKRQLPPEFWFSWIGYFPVDAPIKENWVTRAIALPDYPVAYCEWGRGEIMKYDRKDLTVTFNLAMKEGEIQKKGKIAIAPLKGRIKVIHHGVDLGVFKPLPEKEKRDFRKKFFFDKIKPSTFLVMNISRNQPRKDVARTIAAYAEFRKKVPDSHLYLHMKALDAGGSIDEIARNFGLSRGEHFSVPAEFAPGVGYPVETVNKLYNAADLCVTTSLGEGWGFILTEAMATKTPIIAPNISSMLDIFDSYVPEGRDLNEWWLREGHEKTRGIPVKAGSTSSEWICLGLEDNERIRPLTNVDDLVQKMWWVYNNRKSRALTDMVERAYAWVQGLSWENIVAEWDGLFTEAYGKLEKERELGRRIDKTGRNDPCPCGSGLKFKKCHGNPDRIAKMRDLLAEPVKDRGLISQAQNGKKARERAE